jgi:hypothetical protein
MVHNVGVSDPFIYADARSDSPMEYLDAGSPERPKRKARRWAPVVAGAITFVLTLVVVGSLVGDWAVRNVEMRQLISQIEVSEQAMAGTQVGIANAVGEFRDKEQPTAADQAALEAALKAAAANGLVGVINGGGLVEGVRVLPWHTGITDAQRAYLAHNKAWQDYLTKASTDVAEFSKEQVAINETFAAAEAPMRGAVPSPDLFELGLRVNVIYAADPTAEDGSGQQA